MSESRKPENPPAFPVPEIRAGDGTGIMEGSRGMTLRDYFAGQALAGWLASFTDGESPPFITQLGTFAYEVADAMLLARATGGADV